MVLFTVRTLAWRKLLLILGQIGTILWSIQNIGKTELELIHSHKLLSLLKWVLINLQYFSILRVVSKKSR